VTIRRSECVACIGRSKGKDPPPLPWYHDCMGSRIPNIPPASYLRRTISPLLPVTDPSRCLHCPWKCTVIGQTPENNQLRTATSPFRWSFCTTRCLPGTSGPSFDLIGAWLWNLRKSSKVHAPKRDSNWKPWTSHHGGLSFISPSSTSRNRSFSGNSA